jgi:type I restriction enzyme, S subunit
MSEVVPEGWNLRLMGSGINLLSGFPFKSENFSNEPSHTGLIRIRDLVNQKLKTFYGGEFEQQYLVTKGDILIGMDGDFTIVKWNSENALLNQRICKIDVPENSDLHLDYLFHDLQDELLRIHEKTGSTTVKHLSVKDIRGIEKAFPPLPEQKKIASILTSVDEVIEKTQSQIDKLQDLKKGTMNELLTKGIGHTEFKDSELGKIPKSWECVKLGRIAKVTDGAHKTPKYLDSGVPFLRVTDIQSTEINITKTKYISREEHQELCKRCLPEKGDVLLSKNGTIGITKIINWDWEFSIFVSLALLKIHNKDNVNVEFLDLYLQSPIVRKQIKDRAKQGSVTNLHLEEIRDFDFVIPSTEEQNRIVCIVSSIETKIRTIVHKLHQTQSLKKSLMQDLLTGKVRVSVN